MKSSVAAAENTTEEYQGKPNYVAGLIALLKWARSPVSENSATQIFNMQYAMSGRLVSKLVKQMRTHPEGKRLLEERPDLGKMLIDFESLKKFPEGSIGRDYCEFMTSSPDIVPGWMIGATGLKDGTLDKTDWTDEMKWLILRLGNTHDTVHMLSGYGAEILGEVLNGVFSVAQFNSIGLRIKPLVMLVGGPIAYAMFRPSCGFVQWNRYVSEAYDRGLAAANAMPITCIPFEEWFSLSIDEVRRKLSIPPVKNPAMLNGGMADWPLNKKFAEAVTGGFGAKNSILKGVREVTTLVNAGIPVKVIAEADLIKRELASELIAKGMGTDAAIVVLQA